MRTNPTYLTHRVGKIDGGTIKAEGTEEYGRQSGKYGSLLRGPA